MFNMNRIEGFVILLCYVHLSSGILNDDLADDVPPPPKPKPEEYKYVSSLLIARNLKPYEILDCCYGEEAKTPKGYPVIYCFKARNKSLETLWMTSEVLISLNPEQYDLYWGANKDQVVEQFLADQSILKFSGIFFWKQKNIKLNPFNSTCFGIVTTEAKYSLELRVTKHNTLRQWLFIGGMVLFYLAERLAPDRFFYYATGVIGGVLLSFMILLYFLLSLMPLKKTTVATIMTGGGGLLMFALDWILSVVRTLVIKYQAYVTGYVMTSAIVSLLICYRYGPITNPQSINIVKWALQAAGLAAIWLSSYNEAATIVIITSMVVLYYLPVIKISSQIVRSVIWPLKWSVVFMYKVVTASVTWYLNTIEKAYEILKKIFFRIWYKIRGYPPRQLLTRQQYRQQGRRATSAALNRLYNDYHSHTIDPFESLYRMTPTARERMLRFLTEREGHVPADERDEHTANYDGIMTDDEGGDDDSED